MTRRSASHSQAIAATAFQRDFWWLERVTGRRGLYNVSATARVDSSVDVAALATAAVRIATRQPALRTRLVVTDDVLVALVSDKPDAFIDINAIEVEYDSWDVIARQLAREPFDLATAPTVRIRLVSVPPADAGTARPVPDPMVVVVSHHALLDGGSLVAFVGDLVQEATGRGVGALAEHVAGASAAAHVEGHMRRHDRDLRYWSDQLATLTPPADSALARDALAADGSADGIAIAAFDDADHVTATLDRALCHVLTEHAARIRSTPFLLLAGAWLETLSQSVLLAELALGVPVDVRPPSVAHAEYGSFTAVLPILVRPSAPTNLADTADTPDLFRAAFLDALDHRAVTARDLYAIAERCDLTAPYRCTATMLTTGDVEVRPVSSGHKVDLAVTFVDHDGITSCHVVYRVGFVTRAETLGILDKFQVRLHAITAQPHRSYPIAAEPVPLDPLPVLGGADAVALLGLPADSAVAERLHRIVMPVLVQPSVGNDPVALGGALAAARVSTVFASGKVLNAVFEAQDLAPDLKTVVSTDGPVSLDRSVPAAETAELWNTVWATPRLAGSNVVIRCGSRRFTEEEIAAYQKHVIALCDVSANTRVLEIGCGGGLVSAALAPLAQRYVGLDPATASMDACRSWAGAAGVDAEFVQGFAHQVADLVTGAFDRIVLSGVVQFFAGPAYLDTVLSACDRLLAESGRVILADLIDPCSGQFPGMFRVPERHVRALRIGHRSVDVSVRRRMPGSLAAEMVARYDAILFTRSTAIGEVGRAATMAPIRWISTKPYEATGGPDLPTPAPPDTPGLDVDGMVGLFARVLGTVVHPDQDFFDLGGTSMTAARLVAETRSAFGVRIPLSAFFRHPTPRRLTAWLRDKGK